MTIETRRFPTPPESLSSLKNIREAAQSRLGEILTSRIFGADNEKSITVDPHTHFISSDQAVLFAPNPLPSQETYLQSPLDSLITASVTYRPDRATGTTTGYTRNPKETTSPDSIPYQSTVELIQSALQTLEPAFQFNPDNLSPLYLDQNTIILQTRHLPQTQLLIIARRDSSTEWNKLELTANQPDNNSGQQIDAFLEPLQYPQPIPEPTPDPSSKIDPEPSATELITPDSPPETATYETATPTLTDSSPEAPATPEPTPQPKPVVIKSYTATALKPNGNQPTTAAHDYDDELDYFPNLNGHQSRHNPSNRSKRRNLVNQINNQLVEPIRQHGRNHKDEGRPRKDKRSGKNRRQRRQHERNLDY